VLDHRQNDGLESGTSWTVVSIQATFDTSAQVAGRFDDVGQNEYCPFVDFLRLSHGRRDETVNPKQEVPCEYSMLYCTDSQSRVSSLLQSLVSGIDFYQTCAKIQTSLSIVILSS